MLVRNKENRNIAVSKGHQYTVEKVRKAMEFVNHTGRNTTVQEWVEMYNYLKNADDSIKGCKPCAAAKYTASVRNYARLGYLTLLNEGHKPEEFGIGEKKTVQEPIENEEKRIVLTSDSEVLQKVGEKVEEPKEDAVVEEVTSESEVIENVKEALEEPQEEPVEEEKQEEIAQDKPKRGRKSSK